MNPEAQRIAIAEFCGWKIVQAPASAWESYSSPPSKTAWMDKSWDAPVGLPDYLNDLNAMHEVEKLLDDAQCRSYNEILCKACVPVKALFPPYPERRAEMYLFHATAAQRAEALLRVIGKWEETNKE